jgi:hypothetical protein
MIGYQRKNVPDRPRDLSIFIGVKFIANTFRLLISEIIY